MKVIAINGSPRRNGNTATALGKMTNVIEKAGIETEIIHIGNQPLHGCIACGYCGSSENNHCVFQNDSVNEVAQKMRNADGFILGSPTYYAAIGGTMKCFLDRVFYSSSGYFTHKVCAVAAITRRAGAVETYNQMMNYLALAEVIVAPTTYWSAAYGREAGEVTQDAEGIQTLERSAANMAWLINVLKENKIPAPIHEERKWTHFIR